jgi:hypothetical protein
VKRLLIRPGAIGDFIVSLPAMEILRADYTEVWTASRNVPLARFADAAASIATTRLDLLEIDPPARLIGRLRRFDEIVSWYGANRREFRDTVERLDLPFRFLPALPDGSCHAVDFFVAQVTAPSPSRHCPVLPVPNCELRGAVIHPFASNPAKRWPLDRFREVARLLPVPVQWCAGPDETLDEAMRIDDLYELACWLAGARVYIGNDSGIAHLAAAVGTPVVALFGPANPAVWAPRGPKVTVLDRMESLRPEQVAEAAQLLLYGDHR